MFLSSGEIGGYMGLLLGGSVITIVEILDLFIYNIFSRPGGSVPAGNQSAPVGGERLIALKEKLIGKLKNLQVSSSLTLTFSSSF